VGRNRSLENLSPKISLLNFVLPLHTQTYTKRRATAAPNSNEFGLAVARKKNSSAFQFSRTGDRRKFAFLKTILNARKQRQLMQQAMNSVKHSKNTPFEAKSCSDLCAARQGLPCRAKCLNACLSTKLSIHPKA